MVTSIAVRRLMVDVHRYVGLALAVFILIIAVTGSIIAFYDELERSVNSKLRVVEPRKPGWTLPDLLVIREQLEAQDPRSLVFSLQFPQRPDESVFSRVMQERSTRRPAIPSSSTTTRCSPNPTPASDWASASSAAFPLQPKDLISRVYYLHYAFVMPLTVGTLFIAILGLIWALDCFVGLYLTLPIGKNFFGRWKTAWQIKRGAGANSPDLRHASRGEPAYGSGCCCSCSR